MVQAVSGKIEASILNLNFSDLDSRIESVNAGPGGYFETVNQLNAAYPTGSDRFFVVGQYAYYWKGGAWVRGNVFPASEVADDSLESIKYKNESVTHLKINKSAEPTLDISSSVLLEPDANTVLNLKGEKVTLAGWRYSKPILIDNSDVFKVLGKVGAIAYQWVGCFYGANGNFLGGIENTKTSEANFEFSKIQNAKILRVNVHSTNIGQFKLYAEGNEGTQEVGWLKVSDKNVEDESLGLEKLANQYEERIDLTSQIALEDVKNTALNMSGVPTTIANWRYSKELVLPANRSYRVKKRINGIAYQWVACAYNSNHQFLEGIQNTVFDGDYFYFEVSADTAILRVNVREPDIELYKLISGNEGTLDFKRIKVTTENIPENTLSPTVLNQTQLVSGLRAELDPVYLGQGGLYGKTMFFLGDSITAKYGLAPNEKGYVDIVKEKLGLSAILNFGVSGSRLAKVTGDGGQSGSERYLDIPTTADAGLVLMSTNDYGHTVTADMGTFSDRTNTTFYGACHVTFAGLVQRFSGKKLFIATPLPRLAIAGQTGDYLVPNPSTNKNLLDYSDALKKVAHYYGITVIDVLGNLPTNPIIPEIKTKYMPDGLHPNAAGHKLLGELIAKEIQTR